MKVGERLPKKYYDKVFDLSVARVIHRNCPACGHVFTNCEVPMTTTWEGSLAECCPVHYQPGEVISQIDRDRALKGKYESIGLMRIMTLGGVYRRRQCMYCVACMHTKTRHREGEGCWPVTEAAAAFEGKEPGEFRCDCSHYDPCLHKGKPTRWTTGEFNSQGLVIPDVTRCPRCDTKSPLLRRTRKQLHARGQKAKALAVKRGFLLEGGDPCEGED